MKSQPTRSISSLGVISYLIAALFLLYEMAVQVSPSVMVPELMHDLHISSAELGFMASTYFWSYTLMQVPVGLLYDRFSSKTLLAIAILITALGMVFFSSTHAVWAMGVGRFLMGFGSAFAFVGVLMVAVRWFPAAYFALLVGVAQMLAAVGAASGEGPLSLLVNSHGWRSAAFSLAVTGFVLCVLVIIFMRRHSSELNQPRRLQVKEIWRSFQHVLGNKRLWWVVGYAFFSWGPIAVFTSMWGVPYLMQRFAVTNTVASWVCAMTWAFLAITSPIIGALSRRISPVSIMRVVATVGVMGALAILYWPDLSLQGAYIAAAAIGVGAAGQILTFELARKVQMNEDMGFSISFINMGVVAGGAILQPLAAYWLHSETSKHSQGAVELFTTHNFQTALVLVPLSFIMCVLISCFALKKG